MQKLLNSHEAGRILGYSDASAASAMCKLRTAKSGPAFVRIGQRVRYRVEDIEAWLADHLVEGEVA